MGTIVIRVFGIVRLKNKLNHLRHTGINYALQIVKNTTGAIIHEHIDIFSFALYVAVLATLAFTLNTLRL